MASMLKFDVNLNNTTASNYPQLVEHKDINCRWSDVASHKLSLRHADINWNKLYATSLWAVEMTVPLHLVNTSQNII